MSSTRSKATEKFLQQVEPLTYRARFAHMVELGRAFAKGDAQAHVLLQELHLSSDAYERLLALMSVFGSRHGAWIVEGLSDASRSVRRRASRMVALFCSEEQIVAALESIVEKRILCRTLAALVRSRKRSAVDAFLDKRMQQAPEPFVVDILMLGSEDLVRRYMPKIVEGASYIAWGRLCSRHPKFAASWFLEDLRKNPNIDPRRRYRIQLVLAELARRAPDETLAIVKWFFEQEQDHQSLREVLAILTRSRPCQTFDILKQRHKSGRQTRPPGVFGLVRFDAVVHRLGAERIEYLVRHAYDTLRDGKYGVRWFLRLSDDEKKIVLRTFLLHGRGSWGAFLFRYFKAESPDEVGMRQRAFERWSRAAQSSDGTISIAILDWLPRDLREAEARRHLENCASLNSKPALRIQYAGLLAFAEAKQVLAPWLGHPEGEERARAQGILISSIRHDSAALSEAIINVKARKFEQDPVRNAMFAALVQLRIAFFKPEHLESVGAIIDDALDSADLSAQTSSQVERLVVRLFRVDGFWGGKYLAKLLQVRGSISTWGMGDGLTKDQAAKLSPALAQLVETWTTQERAASIIELGGSLGLRLRVVTPMLVGLERLTRDLPFLGVAGAALALLSRHDRSRFTRLVPELLATDASYVLLPIVAQYISRSRQDLLTNEMLAAKPMKGRFASGRSHWVIDFQSGYPRWTSAQQCTYAAGLVKLLNDEKRSVPDLRFALTTLVRLPFADATPILPFANDPRQPVREMAIRGLPWLDARQGVSVLIEALGDDRARWAIYALRKVFSEMRRGQVLAELRAVPLKKVTVAKEVVRLLGELGGGDSFQELLRLDAPGTHRDVRIALLRALWDHLERPETWVIFDKAVRDPDWIVASKLADVPLGRLSPDAEERVVVLLSTILARSEPEARQDLLNRIAYVPLTDARRSLFKRLLEHMGAEDPSEADLAFFAVLQRMNASESDSVIRRLSELASRRRHLHVLLHRLTPNLGPYAQKMHKDVAQGFLRVLKTDPLAVPQYLMLGAHCWDHEDLVKVLIELSKKELLYHEAMVAAIAAIEHC
ncbi:MAG TPA: hypothetical protein PK156_05640, partial [Polyangium sp.]|nr:hypothetical protein [Polyangium sp.]